MTSHAAASSAFVRMKNCESGPRLGGCVVSTHPWNIWGHWWNPWWTMENDIKITGTHLGVLFIPLKHAISCMFRTVLISCDPSSFVSWSSVGIIFPTAEGGERMRAGKRMGQTLDSQKSWRKVLASLTYTVDIRRPMKSLLTTRGVGEICYWATLW